MASQGGANNLNQQQLLVAGQGSGANHTYLSSNTGGSTPMDHDQQQPSNPSQPQQQSQGPKPGNLPGQTPLQTQAKSSIPFPAFVQIVNSLTDANTKDDLKLKAIQEIEEQLQSLSTTPLYGSYLNHAISTFIKILSDTPVQFISESPNHVLRKMILELMHRLPINDFLRQHVKNIITLMFRLVDIENEENVLVCLKIIIELHKAFRPTFSNEVSIYKSFDYLH